MPKYALIINGVINTISYEPVLQKVQAQDGAWSFVYELEDVYTTHDTVDPETKEPVFSTTVSSVPKRDEAGNPIGVLDPAWIEVPDDVFSGYSVQNGAFVAPTVPVIVRIPAITRAQARLILTENGLWDQVKAAVASYNYPVVQIWFEDALTWERDNAYVQALGLELNLTDETMDTLFKQAAARQF